MYYLWKKTVVLNLWEKTIVLNKFLALSLITLLALSACGGGGSSSDDDSDSDTEATSTPTPTATPTTEPTASPTPSPSPSPTPEAQTSITISGQAVASASDVADVATVWEKSYKLFAKLNPFQYVWAAAETGADDNEVLTSATVTLYKVFADDETEDAEVDIGSVTTDSDGQFEILDVELAPEGSGEDTDFYYEVRITKGELELKSPTAPQEDATVDVSPESDLAAEILAEVVDVPGVDDAPLPSADMIESMRELIMEDATALINDDSIEIPSGTSDNADDNILAAANGISAAGGDAEKMFKAASFEAEFLELDNEVDTEGVDLDADQAAGYISRVTREGCDQADGDYMPQALADALGEFFADGGTTTPSDIVTGYNANSTATDVVLATAVSNFASLLEGVDDSLDASAEATDPISDEEQLALYTKRELESTSFSADTALEADQAAAFALTLGDTQCQFDSTLDLFGFIADIVDDASLNTAAIADTSIYHDSGHGCDQNAGEGRFVADIKVYAAGKAITGVVVTSSDTDALSDDDGTETLSQGTTGLFTQFTSDMGDKTGSDAICVALGKAVTYTITATFSDASTAVATIDRNHPLIIEASSTILVNDAFVAGSDQGDNPTVVTSARPLYQWTSPEAMLALIANDSTNAGIKTALEASSVQVKYTYEFSHVDTSKAQISPAGGCSSIPSGDLYSVDSFMPSIDCDVAACATALGIDASSVACRINIQSFLVDENDSIIGQAAGHFRYFCVDTDDDGNCG